MQITATYYESDPDDKTGEFIAHNLDEVEKKIFEVLAKAKEAKFTEIHDTETHLEVTIKMKKT